MTRVAFSTKVLESYDEFNKYLESSEAIERIREEAKKPYVPGEARLGALSLTWLTVTFPFRMHYALFLKAIGNLLYYASPFTKFGLYVYAEGTRQHHYADVPFEYLLNDILVDCGNHYSHDAYELYTQKPVGLDAISIDGQVQDHIHPARIDKQNRLHLANWTGQCAGMSNWIAYLYRETQYDFADPEHHLVSIVKQLRDGSTRESALLQIAQKYDDLPLGLKNYVIEDMKNPNAQNVQDVFKALSPGLYNVHTEASKDCKSGHRISVAVTRTNTYLFNSNGGLSKTTPEKLGKDIGKDYRVLISAI